MQMLDRKQEIPFQQINMPNFIHPKELILDNGLQVFMMEGGGQQLCRLDLVFEAGSKVQSKALQASLCNALLLEGTSEKSGQEIHESLDFYGAYTQLDLHSDRATVSLFTLNQYFDQVLPIFIDAIKNAVFPKDAFDVTLAQKSQSFKINSEKVEYTARNTFFHTIFEGHPYGYTLSQKDFELISRQDLVDFHHQFYKNASLKIYMAGMIPDHAETILNTYLGNWSLKSSTPKAVYNAKAKRDKIHVKKSRAMQSAIRIGRVCFNTKHPDYQAMKFLSVILGGYFGSRLMSNIREDKGLTYGIGAVCVQHEESGYFSISTEVKGDATDLALKEIYYELRRLRDEVIPDDELSLVKNYIMGQILKSADGPFAQVGLLKNMHLQGVGFEFYQSYQLMLDQITGLALKDLANKYLKEEDLCEVVVGTI